MKNNIIFFFSFILAMTISNTTFCQNSKLTSNQVLASGEDLNSPNEIIKDTTSISRKSKFKNAINVCHIAPFFGIYSINYEYLFSPKNGIVARFEYEHIPKTYTDASINSYGMAFTANYRWHLKPEMNSIFLGAYGRYKIYKGDGLQESTKFDFSSPSFAIGLNVGKRWAWNSGFNIVFSVGYGYVMGDRVATPSNNGIEESLDQFEKDYDFTSPILGEFSIGYAF